MHSSRPLSFAIIGGGFCGFMTMVYLLQEATHPLKITLFNKTYPLAKGIAYQSYSDQHLLNVEARNMSAFSHEPGHFVDWCLSQKDMSCDASTLPFTFMPRNVYGRYLESILQTSLKSRPPHVDVEMRTEEVIAIEKKEHQWRVMSTGSEVVADKVLLATGNHLPGHPSFPHKEFLTSSNYFSDPWSEGAVRNLEGIQNLLIIGTGLTMVDVVIGLQEKKFNGKITALSPKGFGILPHRKHYMQREILDELEPPYNLQTLVRLFRKHVRQAHRHGESGETVVDAVRLKTQEIWQYLSLNDKLQFMSHVRHLWGVARHRLPDSIYRQMQQLIQENKLEVMAGRIVDMEEKGTVVNVCIQERKSRQNTHIPVNRVINCTGPQTDVAKQNSRLFRQLLEQKLIRPDELGMGLSATDDGRIIDGTGQVCDTLFAIGSLLKGKLWESTAVQELRLQAKKTAALMLA